MPKFKVRKGATLPYNDGERSHAYHEGEEVDLPAHVAADVANRWMLEPVDDAARFALMPEAPGLTADTIARTGAAHERVQALGDQLKRLDEQRESVNKMLSDATAEQEKLVAAMKEGGAAASKPGESINGVPVRVLDSGDGSTTAGVVHGEPTKLTPGAGGIVQPGASEQQQAPQQAATRVGGGVADQSPTRSANPTFEQPRDAGAPSR